MQIKRVYSEVQELLDNKIHQQKQTLIKEGDALAIIFQEDNQDNEHFHASKPSCKANSASGNQVTIRQKQKQPTRSVAKAFMENPLLGLGIDEEKAKNYYQEYEQEQSLEARVKEMMKDVKSRWTTFSQYVTVQNLFLLYMNKEEPTLFDDIGIIKATETNVHGFFESCLAGKISLTGSEPSFQDVLSNAAEWSPQPNHSSRFKEGNGNKFVSALSDLSFKQRMLFGLPNTPRLRDFGLVSTWLTNLCNAEAQEKEVNLESRHAGVFPFDDPFATARAQSNYCLTEDSWLSMRLRCLILTQLWSISRWNKMSQWKVCDMMITTFTSEGDCSLKQPIIPLYILQTKYKGAKIKKKMKPQKKLLVRRRTPELCGQSALAIFLFERYVMDSEEEVDVLAPKEQWYKVKIFREKLDKSKVASASSFREERIKLGAETQTSILGLANHFGRNLGSFIAKACGLSSKAIKSIGLWQVDTREAHYFFTCDAETIAKLSGYPSNESYWMPRQLASTRNFIALHPEHKSFFDGFLGWTSSDEIATETKKCRGLGDHTPAMVMAALAHLKDVFYQDLLFYKEHHPQLRLWNSLLFRKNPNALKSWLQYVKSLEDMETNLEATQNPIGIDQHELRLLREELRVNNAKLDKIAASIEAKDSELESKTSKVQEPSLESHDKSVFITNLGVMNGMAD